ncbi:ATP7B, partial [Symbiodinium pilosum]
SYNVMIAGFGVALSYLLTCVHRAPLPREDIAALHSLMEQRLNRSELWPQVQIDVSVADPHALNPQVTHTFVNLLSAALGGRARLNFAVSNPRHANPIPCVGADSDRCLAALEMHASRQMPTLSNSFELILLNSEDGSSVTLGADKKAWVRWQLQSISAEEMAQAVARHLEASWLRQALDEGVALFEITPGYVFSFFLVGDCHARVSWDFNVLSPFLSRFLERLQMLFDIEMNSQVIQCGSLGTPLEPGEQLNDMPQSRTVDASMLQADFMRRTGEWPADALTRDARWLPPLVRLVAFKPSAPIKLDSALVFHSLP